MTLIILQFSLRYSTEIVKIDFLYFYSTNLLFVLYIYLKLYGYVQNINLEGSMSFLFHNFYTEIREY